MFTAAFNHFCYIVYLFFFSSDINNYSKYSLDGVHNVLACGYDFLKYRIFHEKRELFLIIIEQCSVNMQIKQSSFVFCKGYVCLKFLVMKNIV